MPCQGKHGSDVISENSPEDLKDTVLTSAIRQVADSVSACTDVMEGWHRNLTGFSSASQNYFCAGHKKVDRAQNPMCSRNQNGPTVHCFGRYLP